eukprot:2842296-Rhodomonas_salina.1
MSAPVPCQHLPREKKNAVSHVSSNTAREPAQRLRSVSARTGSTTCCSGLTLTAAILPRLTMVNGTSSSESSTSARLLFPAPAPPSSPPDAAADAADDDDDADADAAAL